MRLEEKLGLLGDLRLNAYRGHGTRHSLHLKGRLVEAKAERRTDDERGVLDNAITVLQRLESDGIAGGRVLARYRDRAHEIYTDSEGYFQLNLYIDDPLDSGWHEVHLELLDSVKDGAYCEATALALVPSDDAEFAIVSDLDDTVIRSSATDKLEMARLTLFRDARSRTPFEGVDRLYRAVIYVRDVERDGQNREMDAVAEDLRRREVPTLLGRHSLDFAKDMAERGLISLQALTELRDAMNDPPEES